MVASDPTATWRVLLGSSSPLVNAVLNERKRRVNATKEDFSAVSLSHRERALAITLASFQVREAGGPWPQRGSLWPALPLRLRTLQAVSGGGACGPRRRDEPTALLPGGEILTGLVAHGGYW